jgi:hypothetical protein
MPELDWKGIRLHFDDQGRLEIDARGCSDACIAELKRLALAQNLKWDGKDPVRPCAVIWLPCPPLLCPLNVPCFVMPAQPPTETPTEP